MAKEAQDREIVLGTGKMLGLFFVLVIISAGFFTLGYSMGKGNAAASVAAAAPAEVPAPTPVPASGKKPVATQAEQAENGCPKGEICEEASSDELSFLRPADQKADAGTAAEPRPSPAEAAAQQARTPEFTTTTAQPLGYTVQVAAVSKQEDAEALVSALRKKQYPVFVLGNQNDKLFRVQVGPFPVLKDAEDMRARLNGDGYNAILKK